MVIANNEINTHVFSIPDEVNRFNAAIKRNDKREPLFFCKINPGFTYSVSFAVAVWYIKIERGMKLAKKLIHTGYRSSAVYIVIAIYENFFLVFNSGNDPAHRFIHVFHEPGIMQIGKLRAVK